MTHTEELKAIAGRRAAAIVPGAPNALFARIIEDLGFEVVYVTGAGIANMHLGAPDIGLTSLTEVAHVVSAIAEAVDIPLIVDGDTGFGNALNVHRTTRLLERAGAAGIQIEDQVFPKRCGHFTGKAIVTQNEMIGKIKAAADARLDTDLQIIARTDAIAVEGIDRALERARSFVEAGADLTFVEAPVSVEQLARIPRDLDAPQVANVVVGGVTPELAARQFAEFGFSLVVYANAALQAAMKASFEVLRVLKEAGSLEAVADRLVSFEERQRAVQKPRWDQLEGRYGV
jgi:2-methylisocitrate lyase-like PEP mutase family enzyme